MTGSIVVIAGGVGGAKMVQGFVDICAPGTVSVIGNVGDDWEFHGLWVSPDIDTVTYTLAGLIDQEKGWGVQDESFRVLTALRGLGRETWMQLGDQDLAVHIYRTERRRNGDRPSDIARDIAERLGVPATILLPTDNTLHTKVETPMGWLAFQEYFVRERCVPTVTGVRIEGAETAVATPEALAAIAAADLIVIAPSNPIVSIGPILAVPGIREALAGRTVPCVAVSPLVGGKAIKGPAVQMMTALGHTADAIGVAGIYGDLVDAFVIDEVDQALAPELARPGRDIWVEQTVMRTAEDKGALAKRIMERIAEMGLGKVHS